MTEEQKEILRKLEDLERAYCAEGMTITQYMRGIIRSVFEVTAEVLSDRRSS